MELQETIKKIFTAGKGIFANDASVATLGKRFGKFGIEASEENRNEFRRVFYTAPGAGTYVSGVILNEEGVHLAPLLSAAGIEIGVKVDEGLAPFGDNGEFTTKGLESLDSRLTKHKSTGTSFVKWRAAFAISDSTPSDAAIQENIRLLVEYARISLAHQLVPIIEPEVLMEGEHSMDDCDRATRKVLTSL
ncbi:MAG: class I fructose-bisphosphate aldolase, partial [Microgenomates group bacterium]